MPRRSSRPYLMQKGVSWFRVLEHETSQGAADALVTAMKETTLLSHRLKPTSTTLMLASIAALFNALDGSPDQQSRLIAKIQSRASTAEMQILGFLPESNMLRHEIPFLSASTSAGFFLRQANTRHEVFPQPTHPALDPFNAESVKSIRFEGLLSGTSQPQAITITTEKSSHRVLVKQEFEYSIFSTILATAVQEYLNHIWSEAESGTVCVCHAVVPLHRNTAMISYFDEIRFASAKDFKSHATTPSATSSLVGMLLAGQLLGLGDRKKDNILFNQNSKQFINIDFGVSHNSFPGTEGEVPEELVRAMPFSEFSHHYHVPLRDAFFALWSKRDEIQRVVQRYASLLPRGEEDDVMAFVNKMLCFGSASNQAYTSISCFSELMGRLKRAYYIRWDGTPRSHFQLQTSILEKERLFEVRQRQLAAFFDNERDVVDITLMLGLDISKHPFPQFHSVQLDWIRSHYYHTSTATSPLLYLEKYATFCRNRMEQKERNPTMERVNVLHPFTAETATLHMFSASLESCTMTFRYASRQANHKMLMYPISTEWDSRFMFPSLYRVLNLVWSTGVSETTKDPLGYEKTMALSSGFVGVEATSTIALMKDHIDALPEKDRKIQLAAHLITAYLFGIETLDMGRMMYHQGRGTISHREQIPIRTRKVCLIPAFIVDYYDGSVERVEKELVVSPEFINLFRDVVFAASRIDTTLINMLYLEQRRTKTYKKLNTHPVLVWFRDLLHFDFDRGIFSSTTSPVLHDFMQSCFPS